MEDPRITRTARVWVSPNPRTHVLYRNGILLGQILTVGDGIAATVLGGAGPRKTMLFGTIEEAKAFVENACDEQSVEKLRAANSARKT
jgi:hypothetical protein